MNQRLSFEIMPFDLLKILCRIWSVCLSRKISNQKEEKERQKEKESIKLLYMWNILTKDEIYCSYLQ